MEIRHTVFAGCAALLLGASATAQAAEPRPGLWEYAIEMEMPGMPMKMPSQKVQHCLTAKDVAEGRQYAADPKQQCRMSNLKQNGNQVSYDMACVTDAGKMTVSATGTSTPDSMNMRMKMKVEAGGSDMPEMTQVVTGRRVGDCKG